MSFLGLASKIVDAAGPLIPALRTAPDKKIVDRAVKEADSAGSTPDAGKSPPMIGEIVSTHHVARMMAEPALAWEGTGWRCPEATRLTIIFADGGERTLDYPAGTRIQVAAGMIHLPLCEG